MRTEGLASPLTVTVGSASYAFTPGRDVQVGRDSGCDIRLDDVDDGRWTSHLDVVLRFVGDHWIAVDSSRHGIYVDGIRVSAVDIHDGKVITVGNPWHGPRLLFRVAPSVNLTTRHAGDVSSDAHSMERGPRPSPGDAPTRPMRTTRSDPETPRVEPPQDQKPKKLPLRRDAPAQEDEPPTGPLRRVTADTPVWKPAWPLRDGVAANRLGLTVDGHALLTDVTFTARPGTLTAVVGPSGARATALISVLGGGKHPSSGEVTVDGHDVHGECESLRSFIGTVPREPLVHRRLTVERALTYAAELRLPPDTTPDARRDVVDRALDELGLTPHRATKVSRLSPELVQRASVAVELLSRPSLLVVDAQNAGNAESGQQLMAPLRRLAGAGSVVVVATTPVTSLDMCDQVLLLTSAGTTAFAGPPAQIDAAMGTSDWSDIFARLRSDPDGAHDAFLAWRRRGQALGPSFRSARREASGPALPPVAAVEPWSAQLRRQIFLVARRQARLLVGGTGYFTFLAILPLALGTLALTVPGKAGLGRADPFGANPNEPLEILIVLNIAAVLIGTALTILELLGERPIFRREQSLGLSPSAYLIGKIAVFSVAAAIATAILTAIVVVGKGGPVRGAVLLGSPLVELYLAVAATAVVSAIVGLALSGLANSFKELLPMVAVVILASLVFAGGLVQIAGTVALNQISWLVPAHWGFAASAAVVDLRRVDLLAKQTVLWTHYSGWWIFDMAILVALGAVWAGFLWWRLLPPRRCSPITTSPTTNRAQQELSHLVG